MTKYSREKINFAKTEIVPLLDLIKSLRRIGIYGSVAEGRAKKSSDIDLILVCQDNFLHLCRFIANWRLWRAGWRNQVSIGVVVSESFLKPETLQTNSSDKFTKRWFKTIQWIWRNKPTSETNKILNWLAKIFFAARISLDEKRRYNAIHRRLTDEVFFHFGKSKALDKK